MRAHSSLLITASALAAFGIALAGCGSERAEVEPPPPEKLTGMQTYQSAQELADDLTERGHTCAMMPKAPSLPGLEGKIDEGRCYLHGFDMDLTVYPGQTNLAGTTGKSLRDLGYDATSPERQMTLMGANWIISCRDHEACEKIRADVGGVY